MAAAAAATREVMELIGEEEEEEDYDYGYGEVNYFFENHNLLLFFLFQIGKFFSKYTNFFAFSILFCYMDIFLAALLKK